MSPPLFHFFLTGSGGVLKCVPVAAEDDGIVDGSFDESCIRVALHLFDRGPCRETRFRSHDAAIPSVSMLRSVGVPFSAGEIDEL